MSILLVRPILTTVILLLTLGLLSSCDRAGGTPAIGTAKRLTAPTVLLISPEDFLVIGTSSYTAGPSITGSIQPERRADLRSEVPAVVLEVLKENGELSRSSADRENGGMSWWRLV